MRALAMFGASFVLVTVAAGCGGNHGAASTVTVVRNASAGSGDQRLYGHIKSLVRRGDHFELRFDPAWHLSGVAANVAQAEDQGVRCRPSACPPVANDNYVVDESTRLLTFILPARVRGTVLTRNGTAGGPFPSTRISGAQLAELVAGKSSLKLFEPLSSGVWILVHIDTVRSFEQQYVP
jgi:hypothetical protein